MGNVFSVYACALNR